MFLKKICIFVKKSLQFLQIAVIFITFFADFLKKTKKISQMK